MGTPAIIKVQIAADRSAGLANAVVGLEINLLVFNAAPKPLDEHVVPPGALSVHADGDPVFDHNASECRAGELAALIRVEDIRLAVMSQGILQRLDAERRFHGDRQPPRQNPAAEPIKHDSQIDEAACHRDVRDVHRPYLVRPRDLHPTQQIRMDLAAGLRLRRSRTPIERFYPHPPHQHLHMPAADLAPLGSQQASQHPRAGEG